MKLIDLEKALLKILKQCSKLSFKEQIAFVLKKAEKVEEEELKVVLYLYVNYLVQQFNVKGRTPFMLPPISEVRKLANKLKEAPESIEELVGDIPVNLSPISSGNDLYRPSGAVKSSGPDKSLYSSDLSDYHSSGYSSPKSDFDHTSVDSDFRKQVRDSPLSETVSNPLYNEKKSVEKERKEVDKKVLYG